MNEKQKEDDGKQSKPLWRVATVVCPPGNSIVLRAHCSLVDCGGWALDLFLGEETREHEDIDVQVPRRDQQTIRSLLDVGDVQAAYPTTHPDAWPFRAWEAGTVLSPVVHDVWCRPSQADPWALQLMLAETDGDHWLFRRDARLTRSLATVGRRTKNGIPYLVPELQLLYKAKEPRPKDEADFARIAPFLIQRAVAG